MSNVQNSLRPLWDATLEVYEAFHCVCENYNLRYWAYSGTALGAIRHKGFIPWDDDFDVMMPWCDYEKFIKVAPMELPEYYKVIHRENTPEFSFMYAKVQDVRKEISDRVKFECGHPQSEGIFIDVFPYSGVPHKNIINNISDALLRMRRTALLGKHFPTFKSKVSHIFGKKFWWLYKYKTINDFCEEYLTRSKEIPFDSAEYVGYFDEHRLRHIDVSRKSCYDKSIWVSFENTQVPVPADYDQVLTDIFGDYMKLPPAEQRVWTHKDSPEAPWKYGPTKGRNIQ